MSPTTEMSQLPAAAREPHDERDPLPSNGDRIAMKW